MVDVTIVVPAYREAQNLPVLIPRIAEALRDTPWTWEAIIVDDASPDDTEAVCAQLAGTFPVRLIVRRNERGLSSAVLCGMRAARGRVLVCMDADLSHPPEALVELIGPLLSEEGPPLGDTPERAVHSTADRPDFVIGSRYVAGGRTDDDWGLFRWLNSRVATWLALPLVNVRDPMSGFFALRRRDFLAAADELNPIGYKIGLELLVKCGCRRVREVPIHFRNRLHGESKLSLREQWNYVRHLARLYSFRYRELTSFVRFGLVGTSGIAVDLGLLALLLACGVGHAWAAALAIWGAMTWNFAWNRRWTFAAVGRAPVLRQYLQFCASCLLGGLINWGTRIALTAWVAPFADRPFAAAVMGVLAGFGSNYLFCRLFVFRQLADEAKPADPSTADAASAGSQWPEHRSDDMLTKVERRRHKSSKTLQRTWLGGLLVFALAAAASAQGRPPGLAVAQNEPRKIAAEVGPVAEAARNGTANRSLPARRVELSMDDAAVDARLLKDATYLASDELEGRGVRTKGLELASEYIAREFAAAGLDTAHYNGTPFHEFRLHAAGDKGSVQELTLKLPNGDTHTLTAGADYTSLMVSPKGAFELPVVFAGYGITDPEFDYDDYAGLNASGKAVIVLRHEPHRPGVTDHKGAGEPGERKIRKPALLMTKIRNAIAHGAAAVILVTDLREYRKQLPADVPEGEAVPETPETLLDVEFNRTVGTETLPVVHCRRRLVEQWLRATVDRELSDIEEHIEKTLQPRSFDLPGLTVAARVAVSRNGWTLRNVVATLSGSGKLADEALVVGAHYDHLGRGGWGSLASRDSDAIHNGADDNASGTAVLLEVARQLAASPKPLNRRIVFVAFSAEELGLIGSRRYVNSPLVPLSQTIAMLNLDMVGRLRNEKLTVYGTGTAVEWPLWLAEAAAPHNLLIIPRPSGFGPSDHASFYDRGIPVLHFFTGFHPEYHRPGDDTHLLNIGGMRRISRMMTDLVRLIDAHPARPRMTAVDEASILANLGEVGTSMARDRDNGPRLGVILDSAELPEGVRIRQLLKFSPAEQAGLRPGDVILKLNGEPIRSIEQLQKVISQQESGQPIKLEFDRRGTLREIELIL
uniref:M20/M25/M40 family metallo-hydrolase n=1 Tax=Schlesneria paludicola TaxID=360056 RepID=A0A7C4QLT3_9PLAN